jgi:hypothetical protein
MKTSKLAKIAMVVLFILLIVVAFVIARRRGIKAGTIMGGAAGIIAGAAAEPPGTKGGSPPTSILGGEHTHANEIHPLGDAMYEYARSLKEADRIPPQITGGAAKKVPDKPPPALKPWTKYKTWKDLVEDPGACQDYQNQRKEAIYEPNFDWSKVLEIVNPLLAENREFIGVVNAEKDGRTLYVTAHEASPVEAGSIKDGVTFASVPSELVAKYGNMPGLFIFHTHPADERGSPLPSSQDLACAIHFSAMGRYAASVVISKYGVLAYGLNRTGYDTINEAKNWELASSNLIYDVCAAHESIRGWPYHTLAEYLAFYPRYQMCIMHWPSQTMSAYLSGTTVFRWNIEGRIDHSLIVSNWEITEKIRTAEAEAAEEAKAAKKKKSSEASAAAAPVDD